MLTMGKIERIYLDADYILRHGYLQSYATHVYDKQIYFCWPNNFSGLLLILSTVRLLLKFSLNNLKIAVHCPNPCCFISLALRIKLYSSGVKGIRFTHSEFLNSFTVSDVVELLSSPGFSCFCSWLEHME